MAKTLEEIYSKIGHEINQIIDDVHRTLPPISEEAKRKHAEAMKSYMRDLFHNSFNKDALLRLGRLTCLTMDSTSPTLGEFITGPSLRRFYRSSSKRQIIRSSSWSS